MAEATKKSPNRIDDVRARLQAEANRASATEAKEIAAEARPKRRMNPKKLGQGLAIGVLSALLLATFVMLATTVQRFNSVRSLKSSGKSGSESATPRRWQSEGLSTHDLVRNAYKGKQYDELPAPVREFIGLEDYNPVGDSEESPKSDSAGKKNEAREAAKERAKAMLEQRRSRSSGKKPKQ